MPTSDCKIAASGAPLLVEFLVRAFTGHSSLQKATSIRGKASRLEGSCNALDHEQARAQSQRASSGSAVSHIDGGCASISTTSISTNASDGQAVGSVEVLKECHRARRAALKEQRRQDRRDRQNSQM